MDVQLRRRGRISEWLRLVRGEWYVWRSCGWVPLGGQVKLIRWKKL